MRRTCIACGIVALLVSCEDPTLPQRVASPARAPADVSVTPDTVVINAIGVRVELEATVRDQYGDVMVDAAVTWTTSSDAVASVTHEGIVTSKGNGASTITATAAGASGHASVTVTQELAAVVLERPASTVLTAIGDTVRLTATGYDAEDHPVAGVPFEWRYVNAPSDKVITDPADTTILTVDSTGLVTALGNTPLIGPGWDYGPTMVFAAAADLVDSVGIVVEQEIAAVLLDMPDSLSRGGLSEFAVDAIDANGNYIYGFWGANDTIKTNHGAIFKMESSDTSVVMVMVDEGIAGSSRDRAGSGAIYAAGTGSATITATASDTNVSAAARIAVYDAPVGYPIHVNYVSDVPAYLHPAIGAAVHWWSNVLSPTPTAPFTFIDDTRLHAADICPEIVFDAGDQLAPGLHLYIAAPETDYASGWACTSEPDDLGTTAVAAIGLNLTQFQRIHERGEPADLFETVEMVTRHEIGHVLGIGMGDHWRDQLVGPDTVNARKYNVRFTDSTAIAVFDKMAGGAFPPTTPKIPVSTDRIHWDGCAGHFDLMGTHRRWWYGGNGSFITEMTLASLRPGYRYDPAYVRHKVIEQDHWDSEHTSTWRCKDGRFYALPPSGQMLRTQPEKINLSNDVIGFRTTAKR